MTDIVTYGTIAKAIAATLRESQGVVRVQAYDELTDGLPTLPLVQVYPESAETDEESEDAGQATFQAGVRRTTYRVVVDGYARQRSGSLADDMRAQVQLIDAIDAVLVQQRNRPYFGLPDVRQFKWAWQRVTLLNGDPATRYTGVQFLIDLMVF